VTTSMLCVLDLRRAEPSMLGLLYCEGASRQSAIPSLVVIMTNVRARASRAVRARASTADGQT
jgi:hypothetical protein